MGLDAALVPPNAKLAPIESTLLWLVIAWCCGARLATVAVQQVSRSIVPLDHLFSEGR
jgi:hypothetical protein